MRKNEVLSFDRFVSIMAVVFKLHVSSCEMFTFCDVLHDAKQKNINKLSRVRSTDWKSALREREKIQSLQINVSYSEWCI